MTILELIANGVLIGLGATLFTDVIGLFRQGWSGVHGFCCLVGRWALSVHDHGLFQDNIRNRKPIKFESPLGWALHIALGAVFGIGFWALFSEVARPHDRIWQGLVFGLATTVVPWGIFQPMFGWGVALSKMPNPGPLRIRGLITHAIFGLGLGLCAIAYHAVI